MLGTKNKNGLGGWVGMKKKRRNLIEERVPPFLCDAITKAKKKNSSRMNLSYNPTVREKKRVIKVIL